MILTQHRILFYFLAEKLINSYSCLACINLKFRSWQLQLSKYWFLSSTKKKIYWFLIRKKKILISQFSRMLLECLFAQRTKKETLLLAFSRSLINFYPYKPNPIPIPTSHTPSTIPHYPLLSEKVFCTFQFRQERR